MTQVFFVGAGPGDPKLLTIRAAEAVRESDVVFYDELVSAEILVTIPQARPYHSVAQLIGAARSGQRVVRLQIGDPAIFGRLVEQMEALDAAGIAYEIIPGVTAATAAAAAAKVSLTHRLLGRSVAFVSAHDDSMPVPDADTVVYYMGRPQTTAPAIAIENASRPLQRIVRDPAQAKAPSIVISGAVADLKSLPLYGRRVMVTRASTSGLNNRLRALGAEVLEFPVIRIDPPSDPVPLRRSIEELAGYDWIIFTSANGVRCFFREVEDLRPLRAKLCTIGPATQAEVEQYKLKVDLVPDAYVAESLVAAFPANLAGQRILIPRAAVARDLLPAALRERGAQVDVVEAYRTVIPEPPPEFPGEADWVTFTSSSTVKNYLTLRGRPSARIASIGPVTSSTLRAHGLEPAVEAQEYTTDGLVSAILGGE